MFGLVHDVFLDILPCSLVNIMPSILKKPPMTSVSFSLFVFKCLDKIVSVSSSSFADSSMFNPIGNNR